MKVALIALMVFVVALVGGVFLWLLVAQRRKAHFTKSDQAVNQLKGALKSKEVQAEILIESIADGIIVVDTNGTITLVNKAAATLTEWPIEDALGLDARVVLRLLKDEKSNETLSDAEHPFTKVFTNREYVSQTLQLLTRSNKKLFISLVISPVTIPKNNELFGAVAVIRDVSQEKNEEQQRADFISTASHEMRTPVAAIEGYLALALNEKVSKVDTRAREYLEKAHTSTQHLGKLFQDLLTSAKAEDGRLTSHPVVTDVGLFVEQLAEDLRFVAQKKGLDMEFVMNSHIDQGVIDASGSTAKTIQPLYYALVDPDRLREVITNVFDNAVKYTESGKVSLGVTGNDKVVQIRVTDTGPGIPAEDISHLFQKFYRVDNSATRSIGGTGLGLFICRKIIELYSGTIWAESVVGKGSTFYINLPRLSSDRASQLQMAERTSAPSAL
jgi:PAS domain S-box-containing protein